MAWYSKEQPTPFDHQPISGLYFLDGDAVAGLVGRSWTRGQKFPLVEFPSGFDAEIWETSDPAKLGILHLFGEMDLPLRQSPEDAYQQAVNIAEACGYAAQRVGDQQLELRGHEPDECLLLTYDGGSITDIRQRIYQPEERPVHAAHRLMPDELRAILPPLYSSDELGLEALAHVKYFTPDGSWTWYASEFDGEDVLFGLVDGFELELGLFSLSELQQVRGRLGLPIERDLYYTPQTLQQLLDHHRQLRGEK